MKHVKKLFALAIALVAVLAMSLTVFAAGTGTITITPPTGTSGTTTYKIYKVFDADGNGTNISYKLVSGKTTAPAGFSVDTAGNVTHPGTATELTEAEIAAIKAYVTEADLVDTVTATDATAVTSSALANGYYFITTSLGTVVTIDSTNPTAAVNDKNTVPTLDKKAHSADLGSLDSDGKKALAQVGTDVDYNAKIVVGKGAKGYVFHDKMDTGLSYNNDVTVHVGSVTGTAVAASNYDTTTASGDTLTVTFDDDYLATLAEGTELYVVYSATVTSDALSVDPAKNTAKLNYGDAHETATSSVEVYNAKITVTKTDGDDQPLEGAGFVLKNAAGKYYKIASGVVSWVDAIGEATEYSSDATGAVPAFTGLADGTYTLVEKTVPSGYNKAADSTITIAASDFTAANLNKTPTVINQAGRELPSTGGMGTTIFYIVGGILVVVAGVLLITRRRMRNN